MRFLLSIAVVTLWAVIRSNAAPNPTSIETDNDNRTRSLGLMLGLQEDDAQALDLVVDLLSNYRAKYLTILSKDITNGRFFLFSSTSELIVLAMSFYEAKEDKRTMLMNALGFTNHYPHTIGRGFQLLIRYFNMIHDGTSINTQTIVSDSGLLKPEIVKVFEKYFHSSIKCGYRIPTCNGLTLHREYFFPPPIKQEQRATVENCIMVRKLWAFPVQSHQTKSAFYKKGTDEVWRETLQISGKFRCIKLDNVNGTLIELPLQSNDPENGMSVIVYVPDNYDNGPQLISQLPLIVGTTAIEKLMHEDPKELKFSMPKMEMQLTQAPYHKILQFFEPESLFSDRPNPFDLEFGGFSHAGYLYLSELGIATRIRTTTHSSRRKIRSPGSSNDEELVVDRPFFATVVATGARIIELFTFGYIDALDNYRPIDEDSSGAHDSEFVKSFRKVSG